MASADKSTVAMLDGDRKRGDNALDRFTTGKELPGSRIQALFFDREGQSVDWHQRRAGAVGRRKTRTAACDRSAGFGVGAGADGRPRRKYLGREPRPAGCTFCAISASALSARGRDFLPMLRPPLLRTKRARFGWEPTEPD